MRHRIGKRLALPLRHRRVRRRGVRAALPALPRHLGSADPGDGIRRGPREPEKLRAKLQYPGAQGHQMALLQVVRSGGQHHPDDVLHDRRRLDGRLRVQDRCGRVQRPGSEEVAGVFSALQADPLQMFGWMALICVVGFAICGMGLQNGVERVTKVMMACAVRGDRDPGHQLGACCPARGRA